MKNSSDNIGNQTRDLPAFSTVPQPTAPPCEQKVTLLNVKTLYTYGNRYALKLNTTVASGHLLLVAARGAQNGISSHLPCKGRKIISQLQHLVNTVLSFQRRSYLMITNREEALK